MVRQWQTLFFDKHYSNTNLKPGENYLPDFVGLAESMGCAAFRVTEKDDVADVIRQAREINDRPVVIDFIVGEDAQVWPMIAAGASNDEVQYARDLRPLFDDENSAAETPEAIHSTIQEGEQN
jgi:acetolactate synthase-1/2/3 large subunit